MYFIKKVAEPSFGIHEYMRVLKLKPRKLAKSYIGAPPSECST